MSVTKSEQCVSLVDADASGMSAAGPMRDA